VTVSESDADEDRLEALTLALREELLALNVEDVHGVSERSAPPGTRGLDLAGGFVRQVDTAVHVSEQLDQSELGGGRGLVVTASRRDVATNRSGLRQTRFKLEATR
jgi:hypothetical protein